ncbi:hypothetical protein [Pseudoroseicyclus tamaricis]|uniref:Uncharacterized protein n=1 Tax=Pseudoroseicyclus tamaricis TaxID=2705421 RepID=A0A6B2JTQ4_9RHOB|nr:hypothetical protein [Pseudoroseicyclus tamaricis]NDV01430.1 hypothetical protein [Pseudoroseicyclus tamaricis]
MTRQAILHLGMHKTGTTTLQHRLAGYDDGETRYLDLGYSNHSIPLKLAYLDEPPRGFYASDDESDWPAERAAAREKIDAALRAAAPASVILSGEELSTFPPGLFRPKLMSHLRRHVSDIRAIGYVRDPSSFMASDFGQRVQAGFRQFRLSRLYPRYRFRFQGWVHVMRESGREAELTLYDPAAYPGGDVVADFVARVGLDAERVPPTATYANPSLTAEGAAVFYAWRHKDGPSPLRGAEQQAQIDLVNLMYGFGRNPIRLAPETLEHFLQAHGDDLEWIQERIGRPFPPAKEGPVMFRDSDHIVSYAGSLGPELAEWLFEKGLEPVNKGRNVPALMRGAVLQILGVETSRANRLRYRWDIYKRNREADRRARADRLRREAERAAAAAAQPANSTGS